LTVTVIAALVALLDPMGLDQASERHSAAVIDRMTAPFYGGDSPKGQGQISVIEISDATLEQTGHSWPPPRDLYTRLLKRLTPPDLPASPGHQGWPAVIFFDYAFVSDGDALEQARFVQEIRRVTAWQRWTGDKGCQVSPLAKIDCIVRAQGTPVIIGKGYPPNLCLPGARASITEDILRLADTAVVSPLAWPNLPENYRPVITRADYARQVIDAANLDPVEAASLVASCFHLNPAPLSFEIPALEGRDQTSKERPGRPATETVRWAPLGAGSPGVQPPGAKGYDIVPALAMTYALCQKNRVSTRVCNLLRSAKAEGGPPDVRLPDGAVPQWGSRRDPQGFALRQKLDPENATRLDLPCARETRDLLRIASVGLAQLTSGLGEGAAAVQVPCPYHATVDAAVLLQDSLHDRAGPELAGLLQGRAVAIGAAQSLSNDWIETTLSARRPGVHYHAMTLDNLLESGVDLRRQPPEPFESEFWKAVPFLADLNLDWGEVLEWVCVFLVALSIERTRLRLARNSEHRAARLIAPQSPRPLRRFLMIVLDERRAHRRLQLAQWWRAGQVLKAFAFAVMVLVAATTVTLINHWQPVNIVGIFGFTLLNTAASLWSVEGAVMVGGLLTATILGLIIGTGGAIKAIAERMQAAARAGLSTHRAPSQPPDPANQAPSTSEAPLPSVAQLEKEPLP
jgi:hypothetical protein